MKITTAKQAWIKVQQRQPTFFLTYALLIFFLCSALAGCGAEPTASSLTTSSIPTRLPAPVSSDQMGVETIPPMIEPTVAATAISTVMAINAITVTANSPTPQPLTLLPTATPTPTVAITLPTATPTATAALAEMLSQTVVVTAINAVSITVPISHPEPPIGEQSALGPEVANSTAWQPLSATTMTTLQADGVVRSSRIPILMYHYLSTPPANADIYRRDLSVPPELFAAHLDRLQSEGYSTISLYDLVAHLQQGVTLPEKAVILTFDDGYRDNYENAFPMLQARRMTATFFVVIDFINNERPEYLTWDMVREMAAGGMSIEVHGLDHTSLRKRSRADLEFQALRSYETLQNRLGVRPRFLSYPAGEYDADTIDLFQSASYWAALTTIQGATHSSDKLFELHRVRIRNTTTPDELLRLLQLDW